MNDLTARPAADYSDLREWLDLADEAGQLHHLDGASWDLEIGGLTALLPRAGKPKTILFDRVPGFPTGHRVSTNHFISKELAALTLGLPTDLGRTELVGLWRDRMHGFELISSSDVTDGPVFENTRSGREVDLGSFPVPRWHEEDGGRYLGTADAVITRDPHDGSINVGTYRMMLHSRNEVSLHISPGHHGRLHRDRYFAEDQAMPVAAVFGMDPRVFLAASMYLPEGVNELEWAGGVRGEPIEVVAGPVTGLPIPASAEIALEGFVHPGNTADDGPFAEFTGYYSDKARQEPFVSVEAVYHRDQPILMGCRNGRPPDANFHARALILDALIWEELDAAGIPGIRGVSSAAPARGFLTVSIEQRYAGHAKQAAAVAGQLASAAYLGRYVVVVDDDIDPSNLDDVLWALWTRSDPEASVDLLRNCWSTPLDPRLPPEKRSRGEFTNSRLLIDATRPFHWRDEYPTVVEVGRELRERLEREWADALGRPG